MKKKILVVDDESLIRESLAFVLRKEDYEVDEASNGLQALEKIKSDNYDLLITDIEMPEIKGIELLEKTRQYSPDTFVILITAYASIETAISAFRKGASDYILKPLEFEDLLHRVRKIFEYKDLLQENINLRAELNREYDFQNIIGESPVMKQVFELVKRVSKTDGTVLITGKSGTGKELIARAIHYNSKRAAQKFVAINCGAIVETLFESELFGHKKGSFTGATSDKDGLFKIADGGTIFLDEVSEIPLHLQVKLLRVIEEREVLPVGSTTPIKVDVRIITASNKSLRELVEEGKFREDLFYRLNIVEIHLPALEERKEDIASLVHHFIKKHSKKMGKVVHGATNDVIKVLMNHTWKGQVRELENIIERALIFADGEYITLKDLPEEFRKKSIQGFSQTSSTLKDKIKEFERDYIKSRLEFHRYDKNLVASELGISVSSLYRKIDELGIK
ncbi:MAG: Response regulator of zinc sigma-54-dependent two-component system [Ignavibacteriae bacterium]|nr:MAG: Response regulator of zinc sigma-54-dependent two-component system [Ignavibacteriota bacterium]